MKAKLIYSTDRQRYYKLSEKIAVNPVKLKAEIEYTKNQLLDQFVESFNENTKYLIDKIDLICISDAKTHIERLVFVGFNYGELKYSIFTGFTLTGKYTFMSQGGDSNSIYDDKVYLRYLAKQNKLKFEGITNVN